MEHGLVDWYLRSWKMSYYTKTCNNVVIMSCCNNSYQSSCKLWSSQSPVFKEKKNAPLILNPSLFSNKSISYSLSTCNLPPTNLCHISGVSKWISYPFSTMFHFSFRQHQYTRIFYFCQYNKPKNLQSQNLRVRRVSVSVVIHKWLPVAVQFQFSF